MALYMCQNTQHPLSGTAAQVIFGGCGGLYGPDASCYPSPFGSKMLAKCAMLQWCYFAGNKNLKNPTIYY